MHVLLPTSIISSWIDFSVLETTSSILAGWILPSVTSWCRDNLAISRLTGSKQDKIMASGVSSTIISTPVAASMALMFLPSLPIILPFKSSLSMLKTETAFSIVCSAATLCIVWMSIFFASLFAFNKASSFISFRIDMDLDLASFSKDFINCSFACSALNPLTLSRISICFF